MASRKSEPFRPVFSPSSSVHRSSTVVVVEKLAPLLFHRLEQVVDQAVEPRVFLAQIFHLVDRMNDGRVMFPPKASPNFRQRRVCELLTEIHRNLAWHRDRFRVVP